MSNTIMADTHAAVWFLEDDARLSAPASDTMKQTIDGGRPVLLSSITLVEATYLAEKSRLPVSTWRLLESVVRRPDGGFQVLPFNLDMAEAAQRVPRELVPDMPDRIIAATALHLNLPLVTADAQIQRSPVQTLW